MSQPIRKTAREAAEDPKEIAKVMEDLGVDEKQARMIILLGG